MLLHLRLHGSYAAISIVAIRRHAIIYHADAAEHDDAHFRHAYAHVLLFVTNIPDADASRPAIAAATLFISLSRRPLHHSHGHSHFHYTPISIRRRHFIRIEGLSVTPRIRHIAHYSRAAAIGMPPPCHSQPPAATSYQQAISRHLNMFHRRRPFQPPDLAAEPPPYYRDISRHGIADTRCCRHQRRKTRR